MHCVPTDVGNDGTRVVTERRATILANDLARDYLRAAFRDGQQRWQRRFWEHAIRDRWDFERRCDYLHYNLAKHGHVTRVADWLYSSQVRYALRTLHCRADGGCSNRKSWITLGEVTNG